MLPIFLRRQAADYADLTIHRDREYRVQGLWEIRERRKVGGEPMRLTRCTSVVVALVLGSSMPMMSGCAVGMAMHGYENIDTSIMFLGSPRQVVIAKAGPPETSTINEEGKRVDTYSVIKGNEPSIGRAALHAVLDVVTFFFWELIGTAWELGAGRSEKDRYILKYDKDDRIEDVSRIRGVSKLEGG